MTAFSEIVREKMKKMDLSVRAVAKKSGIDSSYLSKILNNKRNTPNDEETIGKIAGALNIDPDYLIISCGKIPSKWQNFFLKAGIKKIKEAIERISSQKSQETKKETVNKVRLKRPTLPDEIL